MAYTGIDKEIYDSGVHFRPLQEYTQQQWTPSTQLASTVGNTGGVTGTEAAYPYIWPIPTGDGGARDISGTQVTKRPLGLSPGALGGKLPGFGNWAKRTLGNVEDIYSNLPLPSNLLRKGIMKWRENREIKRAEAAAIEQARVDQISQQSQANAAAAGQRRAGRGGSHMSRSVDQGGLGISAAQAQSISDANRDAGMSGGGLAQGGRIGYANGEFVDEDINIQGPGFDVNENLMAAAEGIPFMWEEFLAAKAIDPDLTYNDFLDQIDRSPSDFFGAQGGIASIV